MARIEIGKYLAADTRVCGGRLILRGSRILVSDVLELTHSGYSPTAISRQYRGIISPKGPATPSLEDSLQADRV